MSENDKIYSLILDEIKECRKDIKEVAKDLNTVKVKLAGITVVFSGVVAFVTTYIKKNLFS